MESDQLVQCCPEVHPVIVRWLYNLGIYTPEAVDHFLHPNYERDQHDPMLFADMPKVIQRIIQARDQQQSVVIYGDYDADGVCASVVLYTALRDIGLEHLKIYLPHRDTEGYGLNAKAVQRFIEEGCQLLITVDCGISNATEVAQAAAAGIDVIVTDHHAEPLVLPTAAYAIINPQIHTDQYPFRQLAGVGVAFKVAQALGRHLGREAGYEKWLLDLVAISTVTDCMPLIDENRCLVHYGLIVLNKTRRPGIGALIESTHKNNQPVTTSSISYRLGPWINAAGRIDHANVAVALLLADSVDTAADSVARLAATNTDRQQQTEVMYQEAYQQAQQQTDQPVLYVFGEHWPLGLVGLVAGKLVNALHKPAFVLTRNRGEISGSGRSVPQLNMIVTLQGMEQLFSRYGGHAMACGLTLATHSTVEQFQQHFTTQAQTALLQPAPATAVPLTIPIQLGDINWALVEQLQWLQPFGEGNPEPIFRLDSITLKDYQTVGNTNKHLRLVVANDNGHIAKAIAFGQGASSEHLHLDQTLALITTIGINEWNGHREIQLNVKEIIY
ncbi:MAG: single-stranded-DNA-specific exonuclease RecJ [Candidatus Kerfeldbacteria bacterium]|nr:single-stranded-DNA-specific exonuclease RecJ [Candidatus Kerfeldbacteria bacterium]